MLATERKRSLTELAKLTPGRPNASTLWRWCRKGQLGVKLEYVRFGRKIFTSIEALDRFAAAVAALDRPIGAEVRAGGQNRDPAAHAPAEQQRIAESFLKKSSL